MPIASIDAALLPSHTASSVCFDGGVRRHLGDMRRKAHCVGELLVERGGIDDERQLTHMLLPRRKVERSARRIAFDVHVVHRRGRIGGQRLPHLQRGQQRDRGRVERVGTNVRAAGARRLALQRDAQPLPCDRQRQAAADDAGAAHTDVEAFHG